MEKVLENEIGSVLKRLREESGLTRSELYSGVMSPAHAHRVENQNQVPGFFKITEILKRMSLDVDEFLFIANGYEMEETGQFIQRFKDIRITLNVEMMQQLKKEIDQTLVEGNKPFLECLSQVLDSYIYIQETDDWVGARKKFYQVWQILEKKEIWNYQDILLMSNIFYIFDEPAINQIFKRLNFYFELYGDFKDLKKLKRVTKYNYCSFLRERGRQLENEQRLNEVAAEAKQAMDIPMYLECRYYLSELLWMKNMKDVGRREAKRVLLLLDNLEMDIFSNDNRKDWKKLTGEDLEPFHVAEEGLTW
ncbi:helix-turn-helix domain-containing protein [Listeria costaricensis]|uniref:helix-turn-helix domain-containing protein n=1 Tax=Listeria costaricensis TaxID=2026604 RepID=UPI000C08A345|nr:helix-turn-helix transcriptional regulator [Listeria costaricensis]